MHVPVWQWFVNTQVPDEPEPEPSPWQLKSCVQNVFGELLHRPEPQSPSTLQNPPPFWQRP
jgi:hypothetical protein